MKNKRLIKRIFDRKKDSRNSAFITVANIMANTLEMSERQEMVGDLINFLNEEKQKIEEFKTGTIFCGCGNYTDPDNNESFCDTCLANQ